MKSAGRDILFFLVYVSLCFSAENNPVATNREIFFALSDSVIGTIVNQRLKQYSSITIKTSNDTFTKYFRQQFLSNLALKDKTIFENNATTETTLELSVQESSVLFGELFTESFLGRKKVERKVLLTLNVTLTSSSDGKIIFSNQVSESIVDTLNFTDIDQINNNSLPMTRYQKPELSFFDSVLEPAIVIFSTGVAVYLFFTIRS